MKRAVVLAGGGARGGYQIGVWQALRELDYTYDIVTGTSVGALNGALMAMDEYDIAMDLWQNMSVDQVMDKIRSPEDIDFLTWQGQRKIWTDFIMGAVAGGGVDVAPLENTIRTRMNEQKLRDSPIQFGLVTVQYPTFKPIKLTKNQIPDGMLANYLLASAACFPAFKPTQIENARYIDGGYADNLPIQFAVDCGAQDVIAVDLRAIGKISRVIPEVEGKVTYIRPYRDLGPFLYFDKKMSNSNIRLGYLDAMKSFGRYEGERFTFERGECRKNAKIVRHNMSVLQNELEPKNMLARFTVLDALNIQGEPQLPLSKALMRAAEITADIAGVSPYDVYTSYSFNTTLIDKLKAYRDSEYRSTYELLRVKQSPAGLADVIGDLTQLHMVNILYDSLKSVEDRTRLLPFLSGLMPHELIAAKYIYAITGGEL